MGCSHSGVMPATRCSVWHVCACAAAPACVLMCVHVDAVRPGGAGSVGLLDAHASLAVSKRVLPATAVAVVTPAVDATLSVAAPPLGATITAAAPASVGAAAVTPAASPADLSYAIIAVRAAFVSQHANVLHYLSELHSGLIEWLTGGFDYICKYLHGDPTLCLPDIGYDEALHDARKLIDDACIAAAASIEKSASSTADKLSDESLFPSVGSAPPVDPIAAYFGFTESLRGGALTDVYSRLPALTRAELHNRTTRGPAHFEITSDHTFYYNEFLAAATPAPSSVSAVLDETLQASLTSWTAKMTSDLPHQAFSASAAAPAPTVVTAPCATRDDAISADAQP